MSWQRHSRLLRVWFVFDVPVNRDVMMYWWSRDLRDSSDLESTSRLR